MLLPNLWWLNQDLQIIIIIVIIIILLNVCYIITEWFFFLYKSFFVNYILSFSLVGLWTIRLLVQVHRHWVQFTLARRGYDNHKCHNKPQIGNETGVWMASCPEVIGWEFGYFKKDVSCVSAVGSLLGTSPVGCRMGTDRTGSRLVPCRRTVEVEFRPWCREVWVSTAEAYG